MNKTNWSDNELKQLKEITNHRVRFDGYEFIWEHNIDNVWSRHYVSNFKDYNKPMSWIHFHIHNWRKEHRQRQRVERKAYLSHMRKELDIDIKIKEISKDYNKATKDRVNQLINLRNSLSNKDISNILDISERSVRRYRSK